MSALSILIADPHFLTREGFVHLISTHPDLELLGVAGNSTELVNMVREKKPAVVIFDYHNTEAFSPQDVKKIKEISRGSNILVVSSDNNKFGIFDVLESGASSFLTKQCSREEIISAIIATARGEKFFCNKILDLILEKQIAEESNCASSSLSTREIEVVGLIAEGLSTPAIAERLFLSPHTINTHRKNIMKKLGVSSTSRLLMYAVNMGIVGVISGGTEENSGSRDRAMEIQQR